MVLNSKSMKIFPSFYVSECHLDWNRATHLVYSSGTSTPSLPSPVCLAVMQTEYQERLEKAHLEYFLSSDVQSNVSGSQLALDLFGRRPLRHVDFNEHLLHGLVPGAPGGPAGDHPAPLFEVRRHEAAASRLARLHQHRETLAELVQRLVQMSLLPYCIVNISTWISFSLYWFVCVPPCCFIPSPTPSSSSLVGGHTEASAPPAVCSH